MRLCAQVPGVVIPAQSEDRATLTVQQYLDLVVAYMADGYTRVQADALVALAGDLALPYVGQAWATEEWLYPGLVGHGRAVTDVSNGVTPRRFTLYLEGHGPLPFWLTASWRQQVNKPDALSFTYPGQESIAELLCRPQVVLLYTADGALVQRLPITSVTPRWERGPDGLTVSCEAESMLAQLGWEWVDDYRPGGVARLAASVEADGLTMTMTTAAAAAAMAGHYVMVDDEEILCGEAVGTTVTVTTRGTNGTTATTHAADAQVIIQSTIQAVLADLFADYQDAARAVSLGTIDETIGATTVYVAYAQRSVLSCVEDLWRLAGGSGQYTVTPTGVFEWRQRLGGPIADIALNDNLVAWTAEPDDSNLVTRLWLQGAGANAESRVKPTDGGETYDYVEANVSTYGLYQRSVTLDAVTSPAELVSLGMNLLAQFSAPRISYNVTAADRYCAGDAGEPLICVGSQGHLVDDDVGVDITQDIVEVSRDLTNPITVAYVLGAAGQSFDDVVSALSKRLAQLENRDLADALNRAHDLNMLTYIPHVDRPEPADIRDGDFRTSEPNLQYSKDGDWRDVVEAGGPILDVGTMSQNGTADTYARSDHVHNLDRGTAWNYVTAAAGTAGTAQDVARSDHKHAVLCSTPVTFGTENSDGTGTALSRSDHVHQRIMVVSTYEDLEAFWGSASATPNQYLGMQFMTTGTAHHGYFWECVGNYHPYNIGGTASLHFRCTSHAVDYGTLVT